jgi:hypothetical protein
MLEQILLFRSIGTIKAGTTLGRFIPACRNIDFTRVDDGDNFGKPK